MTGSREGIVVRGARSVGLEEVWIHDAGSCGVHMLDGAGVVLRGALVERNRDFGVIVEGSEATIVATRVRATQATPADNDFGDGILVADENGESRVTLAATACTDNARAGVLYTGSTGELSGVLSSGNRFGLVLQSGASGAHPTLGENNVFEGNSEQDWITNGDLPVPEAAPLLP